MTQRKTVSTEAGQPESGSEEEFKDSREVLSPGEQLEPTSAPIPAPGPAKVTVPSGSMSSSSLDGPPQGEVDYNLIGVGCDDGPLAQDLIENVKFYQDVALNYQNTYEALLAQQTELQGRFQAQSSLSEEHLAAIHAAEVEAQQCHQELLNLKNEHQKEVYSAVSRAAGQYKAQLSSAQGSLQSQDLKHRLETQKLQENIHFLEVSLASQTSNLPSVGVSQTQSGTAFQEVFNLIPGMVNQHWGTAQYNSQDQAFSFQKQVRFKQGSSP